MSAHNLTKSTKRQHDLVNPYKCPFREFKDTELAVEFWGLGPIGMQLLSSSLTARPRSGAGVPLSSKFSNWEMNTWEDEQVQPLPRSVRKFLHGWKRAQDLAEERWDAETVVYEESSNEGRMTICDVQLCHAEVLQRSVFSRRVLSACYILESFEGFTVEHQWENFTFAIGNDGWRARYNIYSPGMKPGGGVHHKPEITKSGCYCVRLFYLGAWRCVWVNDQVPIDVEGNPLLPFSPIYVTGLAKPGMPPTTNTIVHLWPLLICKALLKIAAPDMSLDDDDYDIEDELMTNFNIFHALTGGLDIRLKKSVLSDEELMWKRIIEEVPIYVWDEDNLNSTITIRTKSTTRLKKASRLEPNLRPSRKSLMTATVIDSKETAPFILPGLTPAYEMLLLLKMARDIPIKKPPDQPEIANWKKIRWIDWARKHGLYEEFECPRTRYLKTCGLMKLSYAPHLLDVISTDSISYNFRLLCQDKTIQAVSKQREFQRQDKTVQAKRDYLQPDVIDYEMCKQNEQLLHEWVLYDSLFSLLKTSTVLYFPSTHQFASAGSSPSIRIAHKEHPKSKNVDIVAPKYEPLYLQIDGSQDIHLRISMNVLHPRVLFNCGVPVNEYIESSYFILEEFLWFDEQKDVAIKAFVRTTGYGFTEVDFPPGRHYCRIWVHSRLDWYMMFVSDATLMLGTQDLIMTASTRDCLWVSKFLTGIGTSFINWIRSDMSTSESTKNDFFRSYQPDLNWDKKIVGFNKKLLHGMFKTALASTLKKKLPTDDYDNIRKILSRYLKDPEFGDFASPININPIKKILDEDLCDCEIQDSYFSNFTEDFYEETESVHLDLSHKQRNTSIQSSSQIPTEICDLATKMVPCGLLKIHLRSVSKTHKAAAKIQALWRGTMARRCLRSHANFTVETLKLVMDTVFGSIDALSGLMNEFFRLYPGATHAYTLGSGLNGGRCVEKYSGTSPIYTKCKWVPFFQGVFFCHYPVKVHFYLNSNLIHRTFKVYDNDTKLEKPQSYNIHTTFEILPNIDGYSVIGFGKIDPTSLLMFEATWVLTVLCDRPNAFHPCENVYGDVCKISPLQSAVKFHAEDMYIPNKRNFLSGIHIYATKTETISFRAAASNPDIWSHDRKNNFKEDDVFITKDENKILCVTWPPFKSFCRLQKSSVIPQMDIVELVAILRLMDKDVPGPEIERKYGKGELYWPFIRIKGPQYYMPSTKSLSMKSKRPVSSQFRVSTKVPRRINLVRRRQSQVKSPEAKFSLPSVRSVVTPKKIKDAGPSYPKHLQYSIEVIAPNGWPLSLDQWKTVVDVLNCPKQMGHHNQSTHSLQGKKSPTKSPETKFYLPSVRSVMMPKKQSDASSTKSVISSVKSVIMPRPPKEKVKETSPKQPAHSTSLLTEPKPGDAYLELECAYNRGSMTVQLDEERYQKLSNFSRVWATREKHRMTKCQSLRDQFRKENMMPNQQDTSIEMSELNVQSPKDSKEESRYPSPSLQGRSLNVSQEYPIEEDTYMTLPPQLIDQFTPLDVDCVKRGGSNIVRVILTPDKEEAAKLEREARAAAEMNRLMELQHYNKEHILGRQRKRIKMVENLFVGGFWSTNLSEALTARDDAIAEEILNRRMSIERKKLEGRAGAVRQSFRAQLSKRRS